MLLDLGQKRRAARLQEFDRARIGVVEGGKFEDAIPDIQSFIGLFSGQDAPISEGSIDEIVEEQKKRATQDLLETLPLYGPIPFANVVVGLLQAYMLRETNVKDICVELASRAHRQHVGRRQ